MTDPGLRRIDRLVGLLTDDDRTLTLSAGLDADDEQLVIAARRLRERCGDHLLTLARAVRAGDADKAAFAALVFPRLAATGVNLADLGQALDAPLGLGIDLVRLGLAEHADLELDVDRGGAR